MLETLHRNMNGKRASYATAKESLDFETQGERNG
jgi:hypothetical protein